MNRQKKITFLPLIMSIVFIVVAMKGVFRGIDHHEPWRVAAASGGFAVFLFFGVMMFLQIIGKNKKSA